MNGAVTEPCAIISNQPIITIIIMMGANQSFFLTRRKKKSSFKNSILWFFLELISKGLCLR